MRPFMLFVALAAVFGAVGISPAAQDRMPPIPADKLTDAQKKAIEEFKAARSVDISGPFVAMLRSPEVMNRARAMGDYLRFRSSLPPRLSEFVILMTARRWTQQYEWNAHAPLAVKGGLNAEHRQGDRRGRQAGRDGRRRGDRLRALRRDPAQPGVSDGTYARAVAKDWRAGRHRRDGHHRLLHDAGDGDEHGAHAAARRRQAGARAAYAVRIENSEFRIVSRIRVTRVTNSSNS